MGKKKKMAKEQAKERRSGVSKAVWSALLMVGMGLLLLLRPDFGTNAVATILGWVLIAAGAVGVLVCVLSWPVMGVLEIVLSVAVAGFGVFILIRPDMLVKILGVALGIYLALQGLGALGESLKLKKFGYDFVPNLVMALVTLGLGVLLLFFPMTAAGWAIRLSGGGMVLCGGAELLLRTKAVKDLRQPNVVDADD